MLRSASLDHVATTSGIPVFQSGESSKAVQRRYAIPGVVKRIIPLDATTFCEYWWCVPGRLLLPEDAQLLQRDRPRVEAIVSKLIWLWGGYCFGDALSI